VILLLTVKHLLELKRWILAWGSMAEVLGPKSFVDENEKTIDEIRILYRLWTFVGVAILMARRYLCYIAPCHALVTSIP